MDRNLMCASFLYGICAKSKIYGSPCGVRFTISREERESHMLDLANKGIHTFGENNYTMQEFLELAKVEYFDIYTLEKMDPEDLVETYQDITGTSICVTDDLSLSYLLRILPAMINLQVDSSMDLLIDHTERDSFTPEEEAIFLKCISEHVGEMRFASDWCFNLDYKGENLSLQEVALWILYGELVGEPVQVNDALTKNCLAKCYQCEYVEEETRTREKIRTYNIGDWGYYETVVKMPVSWIDIRKEVMKLRDKPDPIKNYFLSLI